MSRIGVNDTKCKGKFNFCFDYNQNSLYDAAPMQKVKIPVTLDPAKAVQKRSSYEGVIPFDSLARLREVVVSKQGDVEVNIHCKKDEQGLDVISGHAEAHVDLICQRCNEELGLDLALDFAYSPIGLDESSEHLPQRYEAAELDEDGEINLHQLVEDELILAIPIVPMHEEASCKYSDKPLSFGEIEAIDDKPNPFDILKQLKKDS